MYELGWEESLLMAGGIVTKMEIRKNFKDRDKLFVCNNDEIKKKEQFLIFSREIYSKINHWKIRIQWKYLR